MSHGRTVLWKQRPLIWTMPLPCLRPKYMMSQHQARGAKSEVVPNKGELNLKWLPHTCLLRGPKEGGNATSTLHSRGTPTKGNKI